MKRFLGSILLFIFLICLFCPTIAYAVGEGNIDTGGGGMGSGTNSNYWNPGDEGVRVTVVRASDHKMNGGGG